MLYDTVIDNTNLPERDTIGIYEKLEKLSYGNGMYMYSQTGNGHRLPL